MTPYPSDCCLNCGAEIGWLERGLQLIDCSSHVCPPPKPWTVDRDGRVKTEKDRPVKLQAKTKGVRDDVQ